MTCKDCKYWEDREVPEDFRKLPENSDQLMYGECRRYAPKIVIGMAAPQDEHGDRNFSAVFPNTEADLDWCGEFQPQETK